VPIGPTHKAIDWSACAAVARALCDCVGALAERAARREFESARFRTGFVEGDCPRATITRGNPQHVFAPPLTHLRRRVDHLSGWADSDGLGHGVLLLRRRLKPGRF